MLVLYTYANSLTSNISRKAFDIQDKDEDIETGGTIPKTECAIIKQEQLREEQEV